MSVQGGFDLILRGGQVATPGGMVSADVGIHGQRIGAIGDLSSDHGADVIDVRGLHVLPGVIDTQVHFREPGAEHKEDLATGSAAAALGGVTAVFEMPNTKPPCTTPDDLAFKLERAVKRMWVDHAFFLGAGPNNADELETWERLPGCAGVKVFMGSSTGTLLVEDDVALERVLRSGTRRVAVHCEDERRLRERFYLVEGGANVALHPQWRDVETAFLATQRLVHLAEKTGRRVHALHITTAEEMSFLRSHRDLVTVECTPQHLTLSAEDAYERLGTKAQMNPPIRDGQHHEALLAAVRDGVVDCIGSDHAPHSLEEKAQPYPRSPSGMTGVQTLVPIMLNHVAEGRLSLERFVDLTSAGPARIFDIAGKGRLAVGYDADITLVDLKAERVISDRWIASKCGWTPFDGMKVTGWPKATIVRGHVVMFEDQLLHNPIGQPIRFQDTRPGMGRCTDKP